MGESVPIARAWRCKHCAERVDPTMACCWKCGFDREGNQAVVLTPAIVTGRPDFCEGCGYDLRGSHGSPACPECGEKVRDTEVAFPDSEIASMSIGDKKLVAKHLRLRRLALYACASWGIALGMDWISHGADSFNVLPVGSFEFYAGEHAGLPLYHIAIAITMFAVANVIIPFNAYGSQRHALGHSKPFITAKLRTTPLGRRLIVVVILLLVLSYLIY